MAGVNLQGLVADFPAELQAVEAVYVGVKKLIADAKANGATNISVEIADAEALVAPIETAVKATEKIVGDL